MRQEQHPWLQWPGATSQEVIQYNNVLATIQDKAFSVPKLPIWDDMIDLRLDTILDSMLTTRVAVGNSHQFIRPFRNAVYIDEDCYREWTLEFYSTFEMKPGFDMDTVTDEWAVRFRLGVADML